MGCPKRSINIYQAPEEQRRSVFCLSVLCINPFAAQLDIAGLGVVFRVVHTVTVRTATVMAKETP